MKGEFFTLISCVYFPFLSADAESTNTWTAKLKPVAAFM